MRQNYKLIVAYEGSAYLGWQKTKEGPSIEESLESVLAQILQEKVTLQAASRTDAGVHARGQVINFFSESQNISLKSINSLLPKDITVLSLEKVDFQFHPTIDSVSKQYEYNLCIGDVQYPEHRHFSWHCSSLNVNDMQLAAGHLVGTHDFSALTNTKKNEGYDNYFREVKSLEIIRNENRLVIRIQGPQFLYKMVRNIVGTLVYVGMGKIGVGDIPLILKSKDRTRAGITAPAHGLCLVKVDYR